MFHPNPLFRAHVSTKYKGSLDCIVLTTAREPRNPSKGESPYRALYFNKDDGYKDHFLGSVQIVEALERGGVARSIVAYEGINHLGLRKIQRAVTSANKGESINFDCILHRSSQGQG